MGIEIIGNFQFTKHLDIPNLDASTIKYDFIKKERKRSDLWLS
jgi:hypothetical protein